MAIEPSFVGREKEVNILQTLLQKTIAGGNKKPIVLISGETGIGKTRLVEEFCKYAQTMDVRVGLSSCLKELPLPYLPLKDALKKINLDHLVTSEKPPLVECVYVVNKAGLLLCRADRGGRSKIDPDIFMGMLNAVADFVKDSMQRFDASDKGAFLSRLAHGERTILINQGRLVNLVVIITGTENEFLKDDMDYLLASIESKHADFLESWDGSLGGKLLEIESEIETLIKSGKYDGIDYGGEDAKLKADKLYANLTKGVVREAKKQPIVLALENIHYASSSLLTFLHYFARNIAGERILLLCTYRTEEMDKGLAETVHALELEDLNVDIRLERLTEEDTSQLVKSVFKNNNFRAEFLRKIYIESAGNPFFMLEILNLLLEKGYVIFENGVWRLAKELEQIELPKRVYDIITNRLDKLGEREREILRFASAVGDAFSHELLGCAAKIERIELLKKLEFLEKQRFVKLAGSGEYQFTHPKIKEVLYSGMPATLRTEYHLSIANCIEKNPVFEDRIEKLAYHFYRSAQPEKSVQYLLEAAEGAMKNYATEDAIRYYKESLEFIRKPTERMEIFEKLGDLFCIVGKYEDAINAYLDCYKITVAVDMKLKSGLLKLKIGNAYEKKGAYTDAERNYTDALALVEKSKGLDSLETARIYNAIGWLYFRTAKYDKALAYNLKALSIAEHQKADAEISVAYHQIGTNYLRKGEYNLAEDFLKKALSIQEKTNDINGISATYNTLGAVYRELGEYGSALESFKKSLEINEKIGDNWRIASSYINIGNLYYQKGKLAEAEECYSKSLAIKETVGDLAGMAVVYNNLAVICYEKGKLEDAKQYYRKSMTIKEKTNDTYGITLCCINLGILYKESNAYEEALQYYKRALELSEQMGEKYTLAWSYGGLAEVYAEIGRATDGLEYAKKALSLANQIGSMDMIAYTTRAVAICNTKISLWTEAEEMYKQCIEAYRQTGNELELAQSFYEYALMFNQRAEEGDAQRAIHYLTVAKEIFYKNNATYGVEKCENALSMIKTKSKKG